MGFLPAFKKLLRRGKHPTSIRFKLVAIIVVQTVFLLSLYSYVLATENRRVIQYYENANMHASAALYSSIVNQFKTLSFVSTFPVLRESVSGTKLYDMLSEGVDTTTNHAFQSAFREQAKQLIDLHAFIDCVMIYTLSGRGNYLERAKAYDAVCQMADTNVPWFQRALKASGGPVPVNAGQFSGTGLIHKDNTLACVARSIINTEKMRSIGVVVVGIDNQAIQLEFNKVRLFAGQEYGIFLKGELVAGTLVSDDQAIALIGQRQGSDNRTAYAKSGNREYMYSIYQYDANYAAVVRTDMRDVGNVTRPSPLLYVSLICILFVTLYIIYAITSGILKPIQSLMAACQKLENQDFSGRVSGTASPEIAKLFHAFNRMGQRVQRLIQEVYLRDLSQKKLELQMLRAQISPHYLYNTLESMRMIAYVNGDAKVAEMSELLAHNLQYGLRNTNDEVTVRQEVDSVAEYIRLISYHYGDTVRTHIEVAEEILSCLTIKLILQPLVENAIAHGLSGPRERIEVEIIGFKQEDVLCFVVADDGNGMTEKALEDLNGSLDSKEETPCIGLKNLHRRLKLYYGDDYGIEIKSIHRQGTTVKISLPIHLAAEER